MKYWAFVTIFTGFSRPPKWNCFWFEAHDYLFMDIENVEFGTSNFSGDWTFHLPKEPIEDRKILVTALNNGILQMGIMTITTSKMDATVSIYPDHRNAFKTQWVSSGMKGIASLTFRYKTQK